MYTKQVLDNGLRIVSEKIPYVKSVSIGIWVGAGVVDENKEHNGISHFIEHMFFKGTEKRSARQIAEEIDEIGGQLNAFTGKEYTCYYSKTLDTHIENAFNILTDMLFCSRLSNEDIEVERNVILEEIGMYEDSPEELVHDMLAGTVWKGNALGYSILGSPDSLNNIRRDSILNYIKQTYTPENTVVSVVGNFEEVNLNKLVKRYFGNWPKTSKRKEKPKFIGFNSGISIREKQTEQVHMCVGFNGIKTGDEKFYPLLALNNIIGGGMSSRLFQKIREEKGLVYSIYSYPSSYSNVGTFTIYAGMNPKYVEDVVELLATEIKTIVRDKFTQKEVHKAKEQLKGSYMLGLESTSNRMISIGKSELLLDRIYSPEEILERIENISIENISEIIEEVFCKNTPALSIIGNMSAKPDFSHLLSLEKI